MTSILYFQTKHHSILKSVKKVSFYSEIILNFFHDFFYRKFKFFQDFFLQKIQFFHDFFTKKVKYILTFFFHFQIFLTNFSQSQIFSKI